MQNKMDFTLSAYKQLISTLQSQSYFFQTFEEYLKKPKVKVVILRHDVDRKPGNALVIAKIEKEIGIRASYYFRIVKESYDEDVIKRIAEMGHEIGYHYENLAEVSKKDPHPRGIAFGFHRAGITQINADLRISHRPTQTDTDTYLISHRRTQTHTDVLAERPQYHLLELRGGLRRIKMVIASRKKGV